MPKISERIDKTSKIPAECLTVTPPIPKSVKIEVTSRCDLKCFFCSVTYKDRKKGDMDRELLFKILTELAQLGVQDVGLFWLGEPLLVEALPEYVAYAKKVGIPYVFITTNGRLATPERIVPLIESGLDSIKFSINACDREQYKKVCGVDAFDQVVTNVKSIKALRQNRERPYIYASTVYDPNSPRTYEELKQVLEPYLDEHYPLRLYGDFTYEKEIDGKPVDIEHRIRERTLKDMMPCWSLFTLPHISYDGFISACYCDHDRALFMADLNKLSFKEAWHSAKIRDLRQKHLDKITQGHPCENCIAYKKA